MTRPSIDDIVDVVHSVFTAAVASGDIGVGDGGYDDIWVWQNGDVELKGHFGDSEFRPHDPKDAIQVAIIKPSTTVDDWDEATVRAAVTKWCNFRFL